MSETSSHLLISTVNDFFRLSRQRTETYYLKRIAKPVHYMPYVMSYQFFGGRSTGFHTALVGVRKKYRLFLAISEN